MRKTQNTPAVIGAALALPVLLLAAGCNNDNGAAGGGGTGGTQTASSGGGKAIYDANGCGRCHRSGGQAPDLTHEGASRDAKWIADHIKDPKSHNPGSRMPAFAGKINDKDLTTLAEYLASQK